MAGDERTGDADIEIVLSGGFRLLIVPTREVYHGVGKGKLLEPQLRVQSQANWLVLRDKWSARRRIFLPMCPVHARRVSNKLQESPGENRSQRLSPVLPVIRAALQLRHVT